MATFPEIKILFYADRNWFMPRPPGSTLEKFTSTRLQAALKAGLAVDIRVEDVSSATPLADLLVDRHEVWFFLAGEDPDAGLKKEDRDALLKWMDSGNGVLITGDHAEKDPLQGLGAGLGKSIPRARHMRTWDGFPDNENFMANSTDDTRSDGTKNLETDSLPQRLLLPASKSKLPHKVFRGKGGRILDKFPDHFHEGEVRGTVSLDPLLPEIPFEWPYFPPKIEVVAHTVNWQNGRTHPLMAVWDQATGPNPQGRIIADSSFHHYVDANIDRIADANGEDWSRMQELYCSLAVWLAPLAIRQEFKTIALEAALKHDETLAFAEGPFDELGGAVMRVLAGALPGVLYHQYLDDLAEKYELSPAARVCGPDFIKSLVGAHLLLDRHATKPRPGDVVGLAMRRFLEVKGLPLEMLNLLEPGYRG